MDRDTLARIALCYDTPMSRAMLRVLEPRRILQYGGVIGFDYGDCEVVDYKNSVMERMANGR